ncbi:MAG: prephenate dehydrogenase/arogenate dehydrogenase family protein, partial [Lachnospiraceae bacterium]|nr:prephenate dehydrogenase/arogenate dehydrogenase family protein [Lachnospiraceae bacterium]
CAPVIINISYLKELKSIIKDTCILTDVGSVKGNIHKAVNELSMGRNFIGGHPMTGSDRTGYENSSHLFMENAYYLLTPTKEVSPQNVRFFKNLVEEMGSIAYITDCDKHDEITAAISHLPHIIASSLVNVVRENDDEMQLMKTFAAGGFKDITRIASSSPEMWQSICLSNPDYILRYIDIFTDKLKAFKSSISAGDSNNLYETFEQARNYRNSIASTSSGALSKSYEIYYGCGNHEMKLAINPITKKIYHKYRHAVRKMGIHYLNNKTCTIERGNSTINVTGLNISRRYYKKLKKINMPDDYIDRLVNPAGICGADDSALSILIAHDPIFFKQYAAWGADIVLSGHVHGGIMVLP